MKEEKPKPDSAVITEAEKSAQDIRALEAAIKALDTCTSPKMVRASLQYLINRYTGMNIDL